MLKVLYGTTNANKEPFLTVNSSMKNI